MTGSHPRRALLIGPVFTPGHAGGLALALDDLASQLRARGWEVESLLHPAREARGGEASGSRALRETWFRSRLHFLQRWEAFLALRRLVPDPFREAILTLARPREFFLNVSGNLHFMEERLRRCGGGDVVILCVDGSPPGLTALATEIHGRVVLLSLDGLAKELRAYAWSWMRLACRLRAGGERHPCLFRPPPASRIRRAVFASRQWREEALRAGLPAAAARTIYFGVPQHPRPRRPAQVRGRLLWVGRLVRDKGLHLLVEALPGIRERVAGAILTVVADQGPPAYRRLVERRLSTLGVEEAVSFRPPVAREALQEVYADHDVLLVFSEFPESVSLVMQEAYAAGLPVVAPRPGAGSILVRDGSTCLCYDPGRPETIVQAVVKILSDDDLRRDITRRAQSLVRETLSLDAMGRAYDRCLSEFLEETADQVPPVSG